MADFWSQYKNDFPDLGGGFKPEIFAQDKVMYPNGHPNTGIDPNPITIPGGPQAQPTYGVKLGAPNDPRVTTQPQPYQQGPGGTQPPMDMQHLMGSAGGGQMPSPYSPNMGSWINAQIAAHQRDPNQGSAPERMNPEIQQYLHAHGRAVGGSPYQGSMSAMGLPPAARMGPNGPMFTDAQGQSTDQTGNPLNQQPMNPGQQSGQVQMQAPDGTMQYVNQEQVPHYQGLGATVMNGSSYGGG